MKPPDKVSKLNEGESDVQREEISIHRVMTLAVHPARLLLGSAATCGNTHLAFHTGHSLGPEPANRHSISRRRLDTIIMTGSSCGGVFSGCLGPPAGSTYQEHYKGLIQIFSREGHLMKDFCCQFA